MKNSLKQLVDPEVYCFLCSKPYISFDFNTTKYILENLTLCMHHKEITDKAVNPPIKVLNERPANNGELIE